MKYKILITIITGLIFLFFTFPVFSKESGSSAVLSINNRIDEKTTKDLEIKRKTIIIKNVLERYNSPLVDSASDFVKTCFKYDLDCYLLPSIAGLESTFGKFILPSSYNPFGWGGGYIIFSSWSEAIDTVGRGLRENYLDKWHLDTVEAIGRVYSESPTWAVRVNWFINQFKKEEEKLMLLSLEFPVEL